MMKTKKAMNTVIVIPVYKNPDKDEEISLRQCCSVLNNYCMKLVCPDSFDTSAFHHLWSEYNLKLSVERFGDSFFKNIAGYNRLLLSEEFYDRFKQYDYMLIYQPDAFVFEDELQYWCKKGYDYIGAPLVGEYTETEYNDKMQLRVGNGGFSLRRVQAYLDYFNGTKHVFNAKQLLNHISFWQKPYTRWLVWLLMMFGWHNTPKWFSANYKWNEDCFWSLYLSNSQYPLNLPSAKEALGFAFERFPKEMYEITSKLPFGCHAWRKYEYEEFWKQYIF